MFGLSKLRTAEIAVALLLTLAALLFAFRVWAEEGALRVSGAWARPTAGQGTAAYLTIVNAGKEEDVLESASTPKAKSVELHQTTMTAEGIMQMRPVKDGVTIDARKTLELKPGGMHFMLGGLDGGLEAGDTLPLTLEFAKAGAVQVEVPVKAQGPDVQEDAGHAHHH